jgi:sulfite dehydrogenase
MPPTLSRRQFLQKSALAAAAASTAQVWAADADSVDLPFANGHRKLVRFPGKQPLILLTYRPPQLETPFSVYNNGIITPNDAFFVRYHLSGIPTQIDPAAFRLEVKGLVKTPLSLSLEELKKMEAVEVTAVNQCSGNSRGFFQPRVNGGQLAHGAMGNAKWRGVRLKDVLAKAGIAAGAKQVVCNGLDAGALPTTPDFIKALEVDHALDDEVLIAWSMNDEDLPWLNGYPLRLIVPGYYGTYWIKHLNSLEVVDDSFGGFWMAAGYRIPDNAGGCVDPGTTPSKTIPINKFKIRSFLTSLENGATIHAGQDLTLRGIAFDSGEGLTEVQVSTDAGKTWQASTLGKDAGRYSFREWTLPWKPVKAGETKILCRAFNRIGETQPLEPLWNPAGYLRNVVETTQVTIGS